VTDTGKQRICFVVSSPLTVRAFLAKHIAVLSRQFDVSVVVNANPETLVGQIPGAHFFRIPIMRSISPLRDALAAIHLLFFFRRQGFAVVHSITPKAGLLSMVAAWLARVPVRLHTFTGQVWVTRRGPMRALLRGMDRIIAHLATAVLVDSRSQREFLIANGVVSASKSSVLGEGSICGVDERFHPDEATRERVRSALGLPREAVLFLYLGRVSRDKGVIDLASAFAALAKRHASAYLLIAGPDEEGLMKRVEESLAGCRDRFRRVDFTNRPEEYMAAADVFCLPSYREGFGQVAIEASAAELPVIASRIYGVTDAVVEGETGLFHAPGDVDALADRMQTLLEHPEVRRKLGSTGRARVLREFSAERVTRALLDYYSDVTGKL
jgi:glycosyltransferase involved in cell wall biosynthesis